MTHMPTPRPTTADPLLAPVLAAIDNFYGHIFRDWPTAITQTVGACTLNYCGHPKLNGANHLMPHTPDALTSDVLDTAEAFFAPYDATWSVMVTDTFMPGAGDLLAARRYDDRWGSPLMVLDGPPVLLPTRLETQLVRVRTRDALDTLIRVMRDAFNTAVPALRRLARADHLLHPAVAHYLLLTGDLAVTCATVAVYGDVATVWNVGTSPLYRHRGYAVTIMRGILHDLEARGVRTTALLSSTEGLGLYAQLGYRIIGMTTYATPPPYARFED
ncbi:MAG: GNAT family N-acetyltransferase [Anaerolineae bacterium]|nr:GNAT family N-acetyltransferase [Anaerolineae bacterium]